VPISEGSMVKPSDAGRRYARGVRIDSCTGYDVGMRRSLALRAPIAAIVPAVAVWLALPASAAQQRTVMTRANQAMAEKAESAAARQMAAQFKWERIAEARDRGCPLHALRLPRDAVAKAAVFARHFGANDPRTVIVASVLATTGGSRSPQVRRQCGPATTRRTVVVDLFYPWLLPSASLTQGTVFVSYFHNGYHVWEVGH
jgi:hypothetical protein